MFEIRIGLLYERDVSIYAKLEFDEHQMAQIRWGMSQELDVSIYAKPEYNFCEMREIRERLLKEKKDEEYFKGLKNE